MKKRPIRSSPSQTAPPETLAKLLNLTPRRIQQLANEGVIPRAERGRYDVLRSVKGYVAYLQDLSQGRRGELHDIAKTRQRLLQFQADRAEIEIQLMRGDMVRTEDVMAYLQPMLGHFRARLLSLPNAVAPQVMACKSLTEIQELLRVTMYEALNEFAEYEPTRSAPAGDSPVDPAPRPKRAKATAKLDRKRVG